MVTFKLQACEKTSKEANPFLLQHLSDAHYVTLQKCFSHPSLVFFSDLTHKTGLQIGGKITNNKPPGPIKLSTESEIEHSQ